MPARAPKTRAPSPSAATSILLLALPEAVVVALVAEPLEVPEADPDAVEPDAVDAPEEVAVVEAAVPLVLATEEEAAAIAEDSDEVTLPVAELEPLAAVEEAPGAHVADCGRSLTPLPWQRLFAKLIVAS